MNPILTIINDGDKNEIRARLEYATTSGENLDYAVNSIYDFIHSRELALVEGLKVRYEGMKDREFEGNYQKESGWDAALSLAIAELDEAITHLKK